MDIVLSIRMSSQTLTTIKLSDISSKNKVADLKAITAERANLTKDSFELVYYGRILGDEGTLEYYGLKNGCTVHVLKKKDTEVLRPMTTVSDATVLQLVTAFSLCSENASLRSTLHRLSKRPEVIENIISSLPALSADTVAIALLQDPDLMMHFMDPYTIRRIAELHPILIEAAQHLAAAVHKEVHGSSATGAAPSTSTAVPTAYSYSLDNLSDDEEMAGDSSQSSDSAQPPALTTSQSSSAITTEQLEAALSYARANYRSLYARSRNYPLSNSSSSTSGASTNSGVITTEMFSQAMQQAFASTPAAAPLTPSMRPVLPPVLPQAADLQRQLAQMHEIGLQDDAVNVQALQFTNGDVQAAIDLVFSGFSDD